MTKERQRKNSDEDEKSKKILNLQLIKLQVKFLFLKNEKSNDHGIGGHTGKNAIKITARDKCSFSYQLVTFVTLLTKGKYNASQNIGDKKGYVYP